MGFFKQNGRLTEDHHKVIVLLINTHGCSCDSLHPPEIKGCEIVLALCGKYTLPFFKKKTGYFISGLDKSVRRN